jgi:hypothetical protein
MDLQELLNTLANQVAFWQGKNDRYNAPVVNQARNVVRDTGRVADDFIGGGMGQAALRGPDALTRQLLLNAALTAGTAGVGAGVGKVATQIAPKVSPEIAALRNFLNREDIMIRGMRGEGGKIMQYTDAFPQGVPSPYRIPQTLNPEGFVSELQSLRPSLGDKAVLWGFDPRAKDATESALEYALKHDRKWIDSTVPFTQGRLPSGSTIETLPNGTIIERLASGSTRPFSGQYIPETTTGTIGVVRVPSGAVSPEPVMPPWNTPIDPKTGMFAADNPEFFRAGGIASTAPGKVVSTVGDVSKFKSTAEIDAALRRLLKQQGVGTKTEKLLAKVPKKK